MSQGLQVWNAAGTLVFDSDAALGGCVIEAYREGASATTRSYPSFAGRTVLVIFGSGVASVVPTISYAAGYPQVTFGAYFDATFAATYLVLAI